MVDLLRNAPEPGTFPTHADQGEGAGSPLWASSRAPFARGVGVEQWGAGGVPRDQVPTFELENYQR